MEWYEIHEEAERLEHAVSPAFEAKLREKLGEGGACPHGNAVLPESPAVRKRRGEVPLSEAREGQSYIVTSLHERDPKLLLFCTDGNWPSQKLKVVSQNTTRRFRLIYLGTESCSIRSWEGRRQRRFGLGRRAHRFCLRRC